MNNLRNLLLDDKSKRRRRYAKKDNSEGYEIKFPIQNAKIEETPKGSLVLKPNPNTIVYNIYVECGYRGDSSFEVLEPIDSEIFPYRIFHSPLGNCGISEGALINSPNDVLRYKWEKSGRLYGSPSYGVTIIKPDGTGEDFEDIPDGIDALDELLDLTFKSKGDPIL